MDSKTTFEQAAQEFLGTCTNLSEHTLTVYRSDLAAFQRHIGKDTPIGDITLSDIVIWAEINEFSDSSWRRKVYALKSLFSSIPEIASPLDGFVPAVDRKALETDPIPADNLERILCCHGDSLLSTRALLVACLVFSGLTLTEVAEALVSDVSLAMGLIATERLILPLDTAVVSVLRRWLDMRPQRGTTPLLITSESGNQLSTHHVALSLGDYFEYKTGTRYGVRNLVASRRVRDVRLEGCNAERLAYLWDKTPADTRAVLKHLTDGRYIEC